MFHAIFVEKHTENSRAVCRHTKNISAPLNAGKNTKKVGTIIAGKEVSIWMVMGI